MRASLLLVTLSALACSVHGDVVSFVANYVSIQGNGGGATCMSDAFTHTTASLLPNTTSPACTPFRSVYGSGTTLTGVRWAQTTTERVNNTLITSTKLYNNSDCVGVALDTDTHKVSTKKLCEPRQLQWRGNEDRTVAQWHRPQSEDKTIEERRGGQSVVFHEFTSDCTKTEPDIRLLMHPASDACVKADRHFRYEVLPGPAQRNATLSHVPYMRAYPFDFDDTTYLVFDFFSDATCTTRLVYHTLFDGMMVADLWEPTGEKSANCWPLDGRYHRYVKYQPGEVEEKSTAPYVDGQAALSTFSQWGSWGTCDCTTSVRTRSCPTEGGCGPDSVSAEYCPVPDCSTSALSTGAIAGIAVGVAALVAGAVLLGWYLHARARGKAQKDEPTQLVKERMDPEALKGLGSAEATSLVRTVQRREGPIPHSVINKLGKLGEGNFSIVYFGMLSDGKGVAPVAVKELWDDCTEEAAKEALREAALMRQLEHPNVLTYVGSTPEHIKPVCIVLELMGLGSLAEYLRISKKRRQDVTGGARAWMGYQVARGMAYLHRRGFVHRDLAARNVMLGDGTARTFGYPIAKVSDFGMARQLVSNKYYSQGGPMPIMWMSPEAIRESKFSEASDVWSFGVLLWELYSDAATPFAAEDRRNIAYRIADGGLRLSPPSQCPQEVQSIMWDCWQPAPDKRPKFSELTERMAALFVGVCGRPVIQKHDGTEVHILPDEELGYMTYAEHEMATQQGVGRVSSKDVKSIETARTVGETASIHVPPDSSVTSQLDPGGYTLLDYQYVQMRKDKLGTPPVTHGSVLEGYEDLNRPKSP